MKRFFQILLIALATAIALPADNVAAPATQSEMLKDAGFTKTGDRTDENVKYIVLKDTEGKEVLVAASKDFSAAEIEMIRTLKNRFYAMTGLTISSFKIVISLNAYQVVIIPKKLVYKDIDLMPYLPSGLQFFYTNYLEYNFRMKVDKYILRIQGTLFSDGDMLDLMLQAIKDPVTYIKNHDQDYLIGKLDAIEAEMSQMRAEIAAAKAELANALAALRKTMVLSESQQAALGSLSQKAGANTPSTSNPGATTLVDINVVKKIAELKRANPNITANEVMTALTKAGLSATMDEIVLILQLF
jgi:hypothetical protein